MSVFAQNIVDMIVDYALRVAVLKKEFWPRQNHSGHNINFKAGEKPSEQGWTGRSGIHCRIKTYYAKNGTLIPMANSHVQYTQTDTVRNYKFTIRTVWQIAKDSFRSVYNRKIVPRSGTLIYHVLFKGRGHSGLSIRTVCTDRKRSFRSVYDRKIASATTNKPDMHLYFVL